MKIQLYPNKSTPMFNESYIYIKYEICKRWDRNDKTE